MDCFYYVFIPGSLQIFQFKTPTVCETMNGTIEKPGTKLIWVLRPPSVLDSIIWPQKTMDELRSSPAYITGLVASQALSCPTSLLWSPAQPSLAYRFRDHSFLP
jgi:hypothetical protein